jgi:hypothetical protein
MLHFADIDLAGELAEAAIPFLGGFYITLVGFRVLGKKPGENPRYDTHMKKWGRWLRIGGPVLMVLSVLFGLLKVYALSR